MGRTSIREVHAGRPFKHRLGLRSLSVRGVGEGIGCAVCDHNEMDCLGPTPGDVSKIGWATASPMGKRNRGIYGDDCSTTNSARGLCRTAVVVTCGWLVRS